MAVVRNKTAFLFDLDGTLIDSVYQHVLAWKSSLDAEGIPLSVWRIHRKIGMSGGLFANILLRETGFDNTPERLERLRVRHAQAYQALSASVQPLPGARKLPDPDLFLTAAERLGVDIRESLVLGDSIWDMIAAQRARALGVGLLSGGYGEDELSSAGAFRVYEDPADLLDHIDEIAARA
jgi:phosphoglycolate phosphatase-like HAD superfamily hydrolase